MHQFYESQQGLPYTPLFNAKNMQLNRCNLKLGEDVISRRILGLNKIPFYVLDMIHIFCHPFQLEEWWGYFLKTNQQNSSRLDMHDNKTLH